MKYLCLPVLGQRINELIRLCNELVGRVNLFTLRAVDSSVYAGWFGYQSLATNNASTWLTDNL